jgi:hypothetical protein
MPAHFFFSRWSVYVFPTKIAPRTQHTAPDLYLSVQRLNLRAACLLMNSTGGAQAVRVNAAGTRASSPATAAAAVFVCVRAAPQSREHKNQRREAQRLPAAFQVCNRHAGGTCRLHTCADPFFGDGLTYSLQCGRLFAFCIEGVKIQQPYLQDQTEKTADLISFSSVKHHVKIENK